MSFSKGLWGLWGSPTGSMSLPAPPRPDSHRTPVPPLLPEGSRGTSGGPRRGGRATERGTGVLHDDFARRLNRLRDMPHGPSLVHTAEAGGSRRPWPRGVVRRGRRRGRHGARTEASSTRTSRAACTGSETCRGGRVGPASVGTGARWVWGGSTRSCGSRRATGSGSPCGGAPGSAHAPGAEGRQEPAAVAGRGRPWRGTAGARESVRCARRRRRAGGRPSAGRGRASSRRCRRRSLDRTRRCRAARTGRSRTDPGGRRSYRGGGGAGSGHSQGAGAPFQTPAPRLALSRGGGG